MWETTLRPSRFVVESPIWEAPDPDEMAICRPYLDEQIETIQPRIILRPDARSPKSFLGPMFSITQPRGQ